MQIVTFSILMCLLVPNVSVGDTPNHLEPIPTYCYQGLGEYRQLVFRALIQDRQPRAWMIVKPSFEPEYAVILDGPARLANPEDSVGNFYIIEYAVAKQKICGYKELDGGKMELDFKHDVEVERQNAKLPAEVGEEIMAAWMAVLKKTRHPDKERIGLDGVTYEFCTSYNLYGKTWSPQSGVTKIMVDCGELLIKYATAKEKKRDKILKRLLTLCNKLQAKND